MLRFALLLSGLLGTGLLGTGCLLLEHDDGEFDDPPLPPPPRAICGDGQRERLETCDDGNTTSGDGCSEYCRSESLISVRWQLATLAGDPRTCPDGFDVAEVVSRLGPFNVPLRKTFACDAGAGVVALEENTEFGYDVQVLIKSSATGEVYGQSAIEHIVADGAPGASDHTIVTDAGTITVAWSMYRNGMPTFFCTEIPVTSPVMAVVHGATGEPTTYNFSCDTQTFGVTELLPSGTYRVEVSAAAGTQVATATLEGIVVPTGGKTVLTPSARLDF
jgi:cysteine-rich repeat protein